MSIQEGIDISEGGTTLTGDGIGFYRLNVLKSAMTLELKSGLMAKHNPWDIVEQEFGFAGDQKEVLSAFTSLLESNPQILLDKSKAYQEELKKKPKAVRTYRGTGDSERVVHCIGGVFDITVDTVSNLLCNALDQDVGASCYWAGIDWDGCVEPSDESMIPLEWKMQRHHSWCFGDGKISLCDIEEFCENRRNMDATTKWELTEKKICEGLDALARNKRYSHHLKNIISGPDDCDGETGDVFLQFCVFGECVYC